MFVDGAFKLQLLTAFNFTRSFLLIYLQLHLKHKNVQFLFYFFIKIYTCYMYFYNVVYVKMKD